MQKIQLSVVVITRNEARNIARCLESVKDIADEMLVVDSESTDDTASMAKALGARVIVQPFLGYVEQKNFALQQASYDYVLSLDADEELSPQLRAAIAAVKQDWKADAYAFNRLNNYCGQWIRHSGWYPDRKIRLLNRTLGKWGGINPHDAIMMDPSAKMERLEGDLFHYSYLTVQEHIQKTHKYAAIMAEALHKAGKRADFVKLYLNPPFTFVKKYFFQLGFLDGYYGWVICRLSAHYTLLKYLRLQELQQQNKSEE